MKKSKLLMVLRLYDIHYPDHNGSQKSLSVIMRQDGTLSYSYYGGWQGSGTGFAISNLQLKRSLPLDAKKYSKTELLLGEIEQVLATGVGARYVSTVEILNEIQDNQDPYFGQKIKTIREMTKEELKTEHWDIKATVPVIEMENGNLIYPSRDSEGNGPGAFFGKQDGRMVRIMPSYEFEKSTTL